MRTQNIYQLLSGTLVIAFITVAHGQTDPLPSWNDGANKSAIVDFVAST
jgi:hypothetical protein